MNKSFIGAILVSLIVGGTVGYLIGGSKSHPDSISTASENTRTSGGHALTPDAMVQELMSKTGASRDETFLENMITHHESAVAMSRIMLGKTERPELQKLAEEIIESQTNEIEMMKGWLNEWYGR